MAVLEEPVVLVAITIIVYYFFVELCRRVPNPIANPILLAILTLIAFVKLADIDLSVYQRSGTLLSFWLGPATVALAVPLYRHLPLILKHKATIGIGIVVGSSTAVLSAVGTAKLLKASSTVVAALVPKSVTTPIAIEISRMIGADPELAAGLVIATGILGAILGPQWLRICKVTSPFARGLAMGTASHAIGTARALQEGELQGSTSGLAIGLAGLYTALISPLIVWWLL